MKRNHFNRRAAPLTNSSRRGFLAASTVALGAAALGQPMVLLDATAASTAANNRVNLALVGCGGQGRGDMRGMLSCGANLVALCDPDPAQIEMARADALNSGGTATKDAKVYDDYRKLLDKAASFDAVLIGTPDHWHAPLCKAFMKIGKHVYCEKPLTHSVAEARELRELARGSKVVTQMGNQCIVAALYRNHPGWRVGPDPRNLPLGYRCQRQRRQRPGRRPRPDRLQLGPVGRTVGHAPL
jgi:SAM-dependent methyltransferase